MTTDTKASLIQAVEHRQQELIDLCSEIIRRPSENPPGDTTQLAGFITQVLESKGLPVQTYTRVAGEPNLVSSVQGKAATPHLVLCGHLDTFPAPDPHLWSFPPFSGDVRDGKILGRGASDMKGGLAGLLFVYMLLHDLKFTPPGKLSFIAVSDEEDLGENGAGWLLDTHPELVPDACIIGEPNSVDQVSIANKGIMVLRFVARGEGYHAGISTGGNAITRVAEAILALRALPNEEIKPPAEMAEVLRIQREMNRTGGDERRGMGWLIDRPSFNVGMIEGGVRFNVVPHIAEALVDFRLPLGMMPEQCIATIRRILDGAGLADVEVTPLPHRVFPPHFTAPTQRLPQLVRRNVTEITGREPIFILTFPSGDIRFFRLRGIPAVVYGTNPYNVGGPDEHITVADLVTIAKVYVASIADFFGGA